ncbi:Inn1p ASCRUDRAFT_68489 [Ascoidea rubescens DSM 1968]|uniref:C2 domain-containing protein n=1 Tax=Ascoidea rubescens DSM 1968 TaxID=1344418 RepID=A0A1D2VSE4_9ASCO|nr:hypothetical protein ASCRUDRAFT_68489 [Ascoidea rubescens DSM 1968]ODV64520.1 hypothetical protein ASCRUDRAFT_68489 [Ascoidea rubescens DSM 1968]
MNCLRANGTLIIVVSRARNLPNRRKLDKQNPYCIVRIANLVDRTSAIVRGGQTPDWNHESRFQLTTDINPILKLSILDETKKSPELVCDAEIDCSPSFNTDVDEGYDKWHPLQYCGRSAGEVYIEMTFYPTSPTMAPKPKKVTLKRGSSVRPLPSRPGEDCTDILEDLSSISDSFASARSLPMEMTNSMAQQQLYNNQLQQQYMMDPNLTSFYSSNSLLDSQNSQASSLASSQASQYFLDSQISQTSSQASSQYSTQSQLNDQFTASYLLPKIPSNLLNPTVYDSKSILSNGSADSRYTDRRGRRSIMNGSSYSNSSSLKSANSKYSYTSDFTDSYSSNITPSSSIYSDLKSKSNSIYGKTITSSKDNLDDLEREVQSSWNKQNSKSRSMSPVKSAKDSYSIDVFKISTALPKLSDFNDNDSILNSTFRPFPNPNNTITAKTANNYNKINTNTNKPNRLPGSYESTIRPLSPLRKTTRKPPPPEKNNYAQSTMSSKLADLNLSTISSFPYSADEIDRSSLIRSRNKPDHLDMLREKLMKRKENDELRSDCFAPTPKEFITSRSSKYSTTSSRYDNDFNSSIMTTTTISTLLPGQNEFGGLKFLQKY